MTVSIAIDLWNNEDGPRNGQMMLRAKQLRSNSQRSLSLDIK